jgi:hypothetical protein
MSGIVHLSDCLPLVGITQVALFFNHPTDAIDSFPYLPERCVERSQSQADVVRFAKIRD